MVNCESVATFKNGQHCFEFIDHEWNRVADDASRSFRCSFRELTLNLSASLFSIPLEHAHGIIGHAFDVLHGPLLRLQANIGADAIPAHATMRSQARRSRRRVCLPWSCPSATRSSRSEQEARRTLVEACAGPCEPCRPRPRPAISPRRQSAPFAPVRPGQSLAGQPESDARRQGPRRRLWKASAGRAPCGGARHRRRPARGRRAPTPRTAVPWGLPPPGTPDATAPPP